MLWVTGLTTYGSICMYSMRGYLVEIGVVVYVVYVVYFGVLMGNAVDI